MTREIKFRALVKYKNKKAGWIYYEPLTIPHAFMDDTYSHDRPEIIFKNLEWTGLKDKHGIEIYEGDILDDFGVVEWKGECPNFYESGFIGFSLNHCFDDYLIIGNIYENPELLEQFVK